MDLQAVLESWGSVLRGYIPALSIEITRECPLHCPGCYAYGGDHLGGAVTLREVRDLKGQELVDGILALVDRHRPLHLSIVGGEPLVRLRELNTLLPLLSQRGIHVQLVTSAVRDMPLEWHDLPRFSLTVSIDGLQPEHDARRTPATYERILKNIAGHRISVHCTITRQQVNRPGYIADFLAFWSARPEVRQILYSLYTPQIGEVSDEILRPDDRRRVINDLHAMRRRYPKLLLPKEALAVYANPPQSPEECVFARMTTTISAGLAAIARHRLLGVIPVSALLKGSIKIGEQMRRLRADGAVA